MLNKNDDLQISGEHDIKSDIKSDFSFMVKVDHQPDAKISQTPKSGRQSFIKERIGQHRGANNDEDT